MIVVGDVMIDRWVEVDNWHPSAEDPNGSRTGDIINAIDLPGGAANAAWQAARFLTEGYGDPSPNQVKLIGATNCPRFQNAKLQLIWVDCDLMCQDRYTKKTRYVKRCEKSGRLKQLMRADWDEMTTETNQKQVAQRFGDSFNGSILICDYGKGTCNLIEPFSRGTFHVVNCKPKVFDRWLSAHCVVINHDELKQLASEIHFGAQDAQGVADLCNVDELVYILAQRPGFKIENLIVTHGPEMIAWRTSSSLKYCFVPKVEQRNVVGAGDAFCAALIAQGMVTQITIEKAAAFASEFVATELKW